MDVYDFLLRMAFSLPLNLLAFLITWRIMEWVGGELRERELRKIYGPKK